MKHLITSSILFAALAVNAASPYINKVYDYLPGMGQFVNVLPKYEDGDTQETMNQKVEDAIANNNGGMITLGGWGGYVIFGFDHMVENIPDEYDFIVLGNAFEGNSEPGIVMVSLDENENGVPDDEWYELAGSEYGSKSTYFNVDSTYKREADTIRNKFHTQPYYPQWITEDKYTLKGNRLPKNGHLNESKVWILNPFRYGYADNYPNNDERAKLKIDWAVNAKGQSVKLKGIHFVKVYNGEDQMCGDIGETSTEITGATDLHFRTDIEVIYSSIKQNKYYRNGQLVIERNGREYNLLGQEVK